ncbi:MAG: GNAT family N-acetyltransferase [Planctomycetota bacterium]
MASDPSHIELRSLKSEADYRQCVALQRETWGENFLEVIPPTMLIASQQVGGICAGAFDNGGQLLGFVFGICGPRQGRLVHWSHMLAVHRHLQGHGLGRRLKSYQRDQLLEMGIATVYWTYDPLVARNAHLNLNRLGARPIVYEENIYGEDTGSELHSLGTDRFVVEWRLSDPEVERALNSGLSVDESTVGAAPVVNPEAQVTEFSLQPSVRVEVPFDIQRVQDESVEVAHRWRSSTRQAFVRYLTEGYSVVGFHRETGSQRCFYVMKRQTP